MIFAFENETGKITWRYWGDDENAADWISGEPDLSKGEEALSQKSLRELLKSAEPGNDERLVLIYDNESGDISAEVIDDG